MHEFLEKLTIIRNQEANEKIINELNLILEYEAKLYELVSNRNIVFYEKRACFLGGVNVINNLLSKNFQEFSQLRDKVSKQYVCKEISMASIINIMIDTELLVQNKETTIININT